MRELVERLDRRELLLGLAGAGVVGALAAAGRALGADKLVVGVIYVGPRDDYGYNQAQAQAAAALKKMPGISAGHTTKTKKLGFIAAKPIPQVLRNINAFSMGARTVDPKITTQLIVTGDWSLPVKEAEATNSLIDQGVDVVTCHVDSPKVVVETAERRGIFVCGYHADQSALAPRGYLTGAEWSWTTPYTTHVKDAMAGKPMNNFMRGGLKDGFVKTGAYGRAVADHARKSSDSVKAQMLKGDYVIFKGPLKDNAGNTVIPAGTAHKQTDLVLEQMNYLVEGVIGKV